MAVIFTPSKNWGKRKPTSQKWFSAKGGATYVTRYNQRWREGIGDKRVFICGRGITRNLTLIGQNCAAQEKDVGAEAESERLAAEPI
jgi:hypothetical protein